MCKFLDRDTLNETACRGLLVSFWMIGEDDFEDDFEE